MHMVRGLKQADIERTNADSVKATLTANHPDEIHNTAAFGVVPPWGNLLISFLEENIV